LSDAGSLRPEVRELTVEHPPRARRASRPDRKVGRDKTSVRIDGA
jgi:hypothetical protein